MVVVVVWNPSALKKMRDTYIESTIKKVLADFSSQSEALAKEIKDIEFLLFDYPKERRHGPKFTPVIHSQYDFSGTEQKIEPIRANLVEKMANAFFEICGVRPFITTDKR